MSLGKHQYLGKNNGKHARFRSKLLTSKERSAIDKSVPLRMKIVEMELAGYECQAYIVGEYYDAGRKKTIRMVFRTKDKH
jgi:hypothetical protein